MSEEHGKTSIKLFKKLLKCNGYFNESTSGRNILDEHTKNVCRLCLLIKYGKALLKMASRKIFASKLWQKNSILCTKCKKKNSTSEYHNTTDFLFSCLIFISAFILVSFVEIRILLSSVWTPNLSSEFWQ